MKKSGAEKKKARRAAAFRNGTRDSISNTPPRRQAAGKDAFQLFAEKVRDHKDLECRWAVLQETRVEYFRGKDFVSFLKNHPELKEVLESDRKLEAEDIANVLLRKNLLVRCDRVVKIVRPGKRKLSTWPAHLEIFPVAHAKILDSVIGSIVDHVPLSELHCLKCSLISVDQVFSDNDAFFAWTFVKQWPLWQTILSFLWPVLTLAICLFPVFPHRCKLLVLYTCAGALLLIFTMLLLRCVIFGSLWIILGKRVWVFPNILAEEVTLKELFRFWPQKDEEEKPKWTARLFYAIVAVLVILLLRHHAPDEAARARYQKRVSNIIDDVLEWSPRLALSGMMETQQTLVNATETNYSTEGSKTSANGGAPPDGVDRPTSSYQYEDEVIQSEDDEHI